jgi:hypothetical protein
MPTLRWPVLMAAEVPGLAEEIGEVTRIAREFGQRHYVPVAERLAYQRRKAALLSAIAERGEVTDAPEAAEQAWQRVRELEAEQAAAEQANR